MIREPALHEMFAQFHVGFVAGAERSASLRFHRSQTDASLCARTHGDFHRVGLREPVIIFEHDAVNPTELRRSLKHAFHVAVRSREETRGKRRAMFSPRPARRTKSQTPSFLR